MIFILSNLSPAYWVHRFGRGANKGADRVYLDNARFVYLDEINLQAACYLLENRNCLTVGWLGFSSKKENYNPALINAVENGNAKTVKDLMTKQLGINSAWAQSLVNFTKMKVGDIVVVLPYKTDAVNKFYIVEIKSTAKSILKSPDYMTAPFNIMGRFNYTFDSNCGWQRSYNDSKYRLDVGFFHEVEVLVEDSPREIVSGKFSHVRSTNSPVNDVYRQREIYKLLPEEVKSRIPEP